MFPPLFVDHEPVNSKRKCHLID